MKHLLSINELFNTKDINSKVVNASLNSGSQFKGGKIDVNIKDIVYRFVFQLKNFQSGKYIYVSFHILNHADYISDKTKNNYFDYEFIINNSMMIDVLNALPKALEEYKKILSPEEDDTMIYGFYYDADEKRRRNIYEYYFKTKLGDRLESVGKGESFFIMAKLKEPVELKNLYL